MSEILSRKMVAGRGQLGSLLLMAIFCGCTKTLPEKGVTKLETTNKDSITLGADYIMSASQGQGSRSSPDSFPYFFGDNKRVQLRFSKNSLIIEEKEKDARFQGNSTNDKTVFEIPVEHLDYRCAQDRFGECTGQEEVNNDVPWEAKKYFKLKEDSFKAAQIESLPMAGDPCYSEVSSQIVGTPEISPEAINFEIEKSFVQSCSGRELSDTNVKARYHYSLVRTDTVLSPGFKAVNYSEDDQNTFGFFTTEKSERDTDLSETESGKVTLLNHWNPDRERIDYYLSDEFSKPENAKVKELTYKTVANLNLGLSKAGAKFRMHLHEPAGKNPGDIRNSMIVLVEDPLASSIIGYGPQTEDPKTGEIISARTTMFLGTIKAYIKYTYEDIVRARRAKVQAAAAEAAAVAASAGSSSTAPSNSETGETSASNEANMALLENSESLDTSLTGRFRHGQTSRAENFIEKMIRTTRVSSQNASSAITIANVGAGLDLRKNRLLTDRKMERDQAIQAELVGHEASNVIPNYIEAADIATPEVSGTKKAALQKLNYLNNVKNCAFSPPAGILSQSFESKLADLLQDPSNELKPWEDLSANEKERVIEILLPDMWVSTLIHELGHNLGLRHNFAASEDSSNFYSLEQIQALNAEVGESGYAQQNLPFANSVMEYIDDLKALKHFGQYDIEALKFTYNKAGFDKDLGTERAGKASDFCTDEHTGINAGCRRHDVGSTKVEIVKNLIERYHAAYEYRNFRRDRADFSLFGDIAYASKIGNVFSEIRLMLEAAERRAAGLPYSDPRWEKREELADLRAAAKLGGEFFLKVISTPDKVCYFTNENPRIRAKSYPLSALGRTTCESVNLTDYDEKWTGFHLHAQFGRLFNSMKDPNSPNHYADQVDVRGYWIDQMMAIRYLLYRQVGNSILDKEGDNYLDLPELREPILKTLTALSLNQLVAPVEVEFVDGTKKVMPLQINSIDSRRVNKPIHPMLARRLAVPNRPFYLTEYFNHFVAHELTNFTDKKDLEKLTAQIFKVASFDNRILNPKVNGGPNQKFIDVGTDRFVASPENSIAIELIQSAEEIRTVIHLVKALGPKTIKMAVEFLTIPAVVKLPEDKKIEFLETLAHELNLTAPNRKDLRRLAGVSQPNIEDLTQEALVAELIEKSEAEILNQESSIQMLRMLSQDN